MHWNNIFTIVLLYDIKCFYKHLVELPASLLAFIYFLGSKSLESQVLQILGEGDKPPLYTTSDRSIFCMKIPTKFYSKHSICTLKLVRDISYAAMYFKGQTGYSHPQFRRNSEFGDKVAMLAYELIREPDVNIYKYMLFYNVTLGCMAS